MMSVSSGVQLHVEQFEVGSVVGLKAKKVRLYLGLKFRATEVWFCN